MTLIAVGIDPSVTKFIYPMVIERNDEDMAVCTHWEKLPPLLGIKQQSPDYGIAHRWFKFFEHVFDEYGELAHVYIEDQHIMKRTKETVRLCQTAGWLIGAAMSRGLMADLVLASQWRARIHAPSEFGPRSLASPVHNAKSVATKYMLQQLLFAGISRPRVKQSDDAAEGALIALSQLYPTGVHVL